MRETQPILALFAVLAPFLFVGCATDSTQGSSTYLSEDELIDLMENPRRWDGKTVRLRIYPYDVGSSGAYVVCFEECTQTIAERSPFIVYTEENRFRGYRGDRSVIIEARYSSSCFYRYSLSCPDLYFGQFTETGLQ